MKTKISVLIITDGSPGITAIAVDIVAALKNNKVSIKSASEFKGNDLLPAEVFFLGCEKASPSSFAYVEDLFKHINLAGRTCGIFSSGSEKAVKYLAALVRDSEAALNPESFLGASASPVKNWAEKIVSRSF